MQLKKFTHLLSTSEKREFYRILALLLLSAVFESTGIALLIPYIYLLQNPTQLLDNPTIAELLQQVGKHPTAQEIVICLTVCFLLFLILRAGVQTGIHSVLAKFPYRVFQRQSNKLLSKYLAMDFTKFNQLNSNVLLKNTYFTVDAVAYAILVYLQYIAALLIVIALTGVLLLESWSISIPLLGLFGGLAIALYALFRKRQKAAGAIRESGAGELQKYAAEALHVFKEIRLYDKASYFLERYSAVSKKFALASGETGFYPLLPPLYLESAAIGVILLIVILLTWQGEPLANLVPHLIFFGIVGRRLLPALNVCVSQRVVLKRLEASLDLLQTELSESETVMNRSPKSHSRCGGFPWGQSEEADSASRDESIVEPIDKERDALDAPRFGCQGNQAQREWLPKYRFSESIEFRNLAFHYQGRGETLRNLSFTIRKGESIAFVGPSGSGKSTLIELITGLLHPSSGELYVDGQQVDSLQGIQHQIGYVPQLISLLDDSIAHNIAFGEQVIDQVKLERAIQIAHLEAFIHSLPNGIHTVIGERGTRLSGGQRQRIGIARAFYRMPDLIVIDEVTASLDSQSENLITESLQVYQGDKTVIAVTHRMATIQNFDRIYVLQKGEIVAMGAHHALMTTCSLYQALNHAMDLVPNH